MDWIATDAVERRHSSDDATRRTSRHGRVLLKIGTATAVVAAVGTLGFILGHDAATSTSTSALALHSTSAAISSSSRSTNAGSTTSTGSSTAKLESLAAKIARSVDPGLVDIDTNLSYEGASAAGTGMVLTSNGLVLTNNHVVDGATSISVRDVASKKVYKATVVGYDVTHDVALLKLQNASGLTTVTIASSPAKLKDVVVGIGNAGGAGGTPSYASGTVVALHQTITASDEGSASGSEQLTGMIETDAAIEAGDSGGPLVNASGAVIGMDTAASASNGGYGFYQSGTTVTQAYAIPIASALAVVKYLEKGISTATNHIGATAFLGVEVSTVASGTFGGFGYGAPSTTNGVEVVGVVAGSPVAQSALVTGDVITAINGQSVTSATQLTSILAALHPGNSVSIDYTDQSGSTAAITVRLASGPPQ